VTTALLGGLPGDDARETAPSVASLIAASAGPVENTGATAMDDLRDDLAAADRAALEPDTSPAKKPRHRRKKSTMERLRRSHQKKVPNAPADGSSAIAQPGVSGNPPKKAELAAMLEQTQGELAAARARTDPDRIGELSTTLEMLAVVGFGFIAESRGAHWALSAAESKRIGETGAVALAPYASQLNDHLPWLAAVTALGAAIVSRVQLDRAAVAAATKPIALV
jgi:hypothetical protein